MEAAAEAGSRRNACSHDACCGNTVCHGGIDVYIFAAICKLHVFVQQACLQADGQGNHHQQRRILRIARVLFGIYADDGAVRHGNECRFAAAVAAPKLLGDSGKRHSLCVDLWFPEFQ